MNGFKKLILTSAILAASSSAMAMQAMDDESLSATTGQDGLTVTLNTNVTTSIKWIDRTGTGASGYGNAGGVLINNVGIASNGLIIDIDAGGNAGTGAGTRGMLNIGVTNPNGITINLSGSSIQVADAQNTASGATLAARSTTGTARDVIRFATGSQMVIAGASGRLLDIDLGSEDDNFMTLNGSLGTVSLTGMQIVDATAGDAIGIGTLTLENLTLTNASVNVAAGGLVINTGSGLTNVNVGMETVTLGGTGSMGDVYLMGLNVANNTITIAAHP
ncbi:MAG: pilus subunit (FilA) [Moraxellaceae bacterium]|jgi:hypothetical protein|nr:pilus subunit (FilA) [Moraxellaceae bacterium]